MHSNLVPGLSAFKMAAGRSGTSCMGTRIVRWPKIEIDFITEKGTERLGCEFPNFVSASLRLEHNLPYQTPNIRKKVRDKLFEILAKSDDDLQTEQKSSSSETQRQLVCWGGTK